MQEVSLKFGLYLVETENKVLKSDGLEKDEYMYYDSEKGICYEDGCVIGSDAEVAYHRLIQLDWVHNYKFFITEPTGEENR